MSGLFSSPKTPKPVKPPLAMDDEALRKSRRKSAAKQQARSGRASTILTDTSEKLGY